MKKCIVWVCDTCGSKSYPADIVQSGPVRCEFGHTGWISELVYNERQK